MTRKLLIAAILILILPSAFFSEAVTVVPAQQTHVPFPTPAPDSLIGRGIQLRRDLSTAIQKLTKDSEVDLVVRLNLGNLTSLQIGIG
jgi:hypothetical protein